MVEFAIEGLAETLQPDFPPPVLASGGVLRIPRPIEFRGCRIDIVGCRGEDASINDLLIEVADRAREALTLCVLPTAAMELVGPKSVANEDVMTGVLPFYPRDLDALSAGEVEFAELVEYKLVRRLVSDRPDADTQFAPRRLEMHKRFGSAPTEAGFAIRPLSEVIRARWDEPEDWLPHPSLVETDDLVARARNVLLIGYSSSGKSVLAIQVGQRRIESGWTAGYVNLGEVTSARGIVDGLLFFDAPGEVDEGGGPPRLFILDDLQSEPAVARLALGVASLSHRVHTGLRPAFLGVSWKEFARQASEWCPDVAPVAVHAHVIRQRLLASYSTAIADQQTVDALGRELGDDIYLLRLALEITRRDSSRPSRGQVAEDVWRDRLPLAGPVGISGDARRVALLAGAVGQFDIHVRPDFLHQTAQVQRIVLSDLIESRLLRRVGSNVTLGHRSLCALIAWWLGETGGWQELGSLGGPADVPSAVLAYLRASGTAASIDALRALIARGGFKERSELSERTVALMDLWRAFDAVVERVETQQHADPTWGQTPSSSMFVTTLLGEIGKPELALPSLDFLRRHWRLSGDARLEIDTTALATVVDFNLLREAIIAEDDAGKSPHGGEAGVDIDIERFHQTWLAGLILGAEAAAAESPVRRDPLAQSVESLHLAETGAFYPQRVPWCTARVLLGLASCGRTVETSSVSRRAADWLLRDRRDGGGSTDGYWLSGTGTWNTAVETTALVLLALIKAGVDPADPRFAPAREYLMSNRAGWAGFEGAATIEALLATGTPWEELAGDAARVSEWALDQSLWQRATLPADEILEQTCHVAQAATHLVEIGWTAMKSDLAALLEAIDLPQQTAAPEGGELARNLGIEGHEEFSHESIAESGDARQDAGVAILDIDRFEIARFGVVGDYMKYDERSRNLLIDRYSEIREALHASNDQRNNYLIWAPPGSGKSFLIQQIATAEGAHFRDANYFELNLAQLSKEEFSSRLAAVKAGGNPTLCMIDEVDSRSTESWPYEELFALLDLNATSSRRIVFVLVGSSGRGINALERSIADRPKGKDLIDRVPAANRFEIPLPRDEDRLVVFAKQALLAADAKSEAITELERLAMYYVMQRPDLASPRQCSEFAKAAVSRMEAGDGKLRFRHLFHPNDSAQMRFFAEHVVTASTLQALFVPISH